MLTFLCGIFVILCLQDTARRVQAAQTVNHVLQKDVSAHLHRPAARCRLQSARHTAHGRRCGNRLLGDCGLQQRDVSVIQIADDDFRSSSTSLPGAGLSLLRKFIAQKFFAEAAFIFAK